MPENLFPEKALQWYWLNVISKKLHLLSSTETSIKVLFPGEWNFGPGPDFLKAILLLGGEKKLGDIEIHIHARDWYAHGHHKDPSYNNVILHLIYYEGPDIILENNAIPPTIIARKFANPARIKTLYDINTSLGLLKCSSLLKDQSNTLIKSWQEQMLEERFLHHSSKWNVSLQAYSGNVQFMLLHQLLLACSFGSYKQEYAELASSYNYLQLLRARTDLYKLLAMVLAPANLLNPSAGSHTFRMIQLGSMYSPGQEKGKLKMLWRSSRARPANAPLIRLIQFSLLIYNFDFISKLLNSNLEYSKLFRHYKTILTCNSEWVNELLVESGYKNDLPKPSEAFLNNILVNFHLVYHICVAHAKSNFKSLNYVKEILQEIPFERNYLTNHFGHIHKQHRTTASQSQALIHSIKAYCSKSRCLDCLIAKKSLLRLR